MGIRCRARRTVRVLAVVAVFAAPLAATSRAAGAAPADPGTPDAAGLTMVRLAPGTPSKVARDVATVAGGEVVDSPLGALGVTMMQGARTDFEHRIQQQPGVVAVWKPTLVPYGGEDTAGGDGKRLSKVPIRTAGAFPDPVHDARSFIGETNPRGILQWDDLANGAVGAWSTTLGDPTVKVAVIDTGVDTNHRELAGQVEASYNLLPCDLAAEFAGMGFDPVRDCMMEDGDGHGTWVAGRIAAAANGFASNGIAPNVRILSYKVLSASLGGGATAWIVAAMVHACSAGGADIVNLSLGGYVDPADPDAMQDYLLWVDAVDFCVQHGVAVIAAAGNNHVRVDRADMNVGGRDLVGVGRVSEGSEGYTSKRASEPGDPQPGFLEAPAGIPGVLMVSATNNATAQPSPDVPQGLWPSSEVFGRADQLAYYSNYGSRVDVGAPGGARKFNLPKADGGPNNLLFGGWGMLGTAVAAGVLCEMDGAPLDFACYDLEGQTFAWLQGSSMSAPSATGVAALVLSARAELRGQPLELLRQLRSTARTDMVNGTPPLSPTDTQALYDGSDCPTAYCHLDWAQAAIGFEDAYGAGIVDAATAVATDPFAHDDFHDHYPPDDAWHEHG
jgi:subtilisin family serine protease